MGFDSGMHSLGLTLQVFFLDILLSGDNAIVIALACRGLPAQQMRRAILIGTGVAIGLRILFTTIVTFLLAIPLLKLLGMVALISIAIKLLIEEEDLDQNSAVHGQTDATQSAQALQDKLWSTIGVIVVADITMSLDNVVALAAISQNSVFFLVLGLALSVPLLMYGSLFVTSLLKRYPILIPAGSALLGWIAGDIGMSDPLIADWITAQLPGLTLAVPLACAIFVLLESKIIQQNRKRFPKPQTTVSRSVHKLPLSPRQEAVALERPSIALPPSTTAVHANETQERVEKEVTATGNQPASPGMPKNELFPPIFPKKAVYFLGLFLGLPVFAIVGAIIYKSVLNKGLMPPPTQLARYECPGVQGSFYFYYRHGKDNVQIQSSSGLVQGNVHFGKISWTNFSGDTAVLGFTPPQEITYDDAKLIRINGGSFLQTNCAIREQNAATSPVPTVTK